MWLKFLIPAILLVALTGFHTLQAANRISAEQAAELVASSRAILVDVREVSEYRSGVAEPALLLPLSDLNGPRRLWGPVLESVGDKKIVLYCASGARSGAAAASLAREGHTTRNSGGFNAWKKAGLPVTNP